MRETEPGNTSWITPGADIVVYCEIYGRPAPSFHKTTVAKVAAKSFTVTGPHYVPRIRLADLESARQGGSYTGSSWKAIRPDDPRVATWEAMRRRSNRHTLAVTASEEWQRMHGRNDREKLDALVDALLAYRIECDQVAKLIDTPATKG
jgi:hypothetical protein